MAISPSQALKLSMSDMKNKIGNLALTNTYYVNIALTDELKKHFDASYKDISKGGIQKFVDEKLGYLCSEATLPVSSYATAEVKDNYMGIPQEFAHTRLYTDVDMTFYVDSDYSVLRFFEGWMDYISGGNSSAKGEPSAGSDTGRNVYRRFVFPDFYKVQTMTIKKFERDFKTQLTYTFINAFPKGLTAIPVSYGPADLLKVTATFNFDRYVVRRETYNTPLQLPTEDGIKPEPEIDPRDVRNILGNTPRELEESRAGEAIKTLYRSKTPGLMDRVLSGRARSQAGRDLGQRIFDTF